MPLLSSRRRGRGSPTRGLTRGKRSFTRLPTAGGYTGRSRAPRPGRFINCTGGGTRTGPIEGSSLPAVPDSRKQPGGFPRHATTFAIVARTARNLRGPGGARGGRDARGRATPHQPAERVEAAFGPAPRDGSTGGPALVDPEGEALAADAGGAAGAPRGDGHGPPLRTARAVRPRRCRGAARRRDRLRPAGGRRLRACRRRATAARTSGMPGPAVYAAGTAAH